MLKDINNVKITKEIARLHAHICGDGCVYSTKTNRSKKELLQHPRKNTVRNRFHINYSNNDEDLLYQFIGDLKNHFGRVGVINSRRNNVDVQGKWLHDLFVNLGAGKSKEWFISEKILTKSKKILAEWVKAFFDDEAYVPIKRRCIEVNSVNRNGLLQIKSILSSLGIQSKVRGPYWYKQFFIYRLCIDSKNIENYAKMIGFSSTKKRKRLRSLLK